jgi:hypothetical protein
MRRILNVLGPLVLALVLLATAFAAFTAYVAYCGMHPFQLPAAFENPPREDAERLGAVLEAGLTWAMRACGAVVTIVGAALAARHGSLAQALRSAVVVLAGVVLISQHWAAGIALGVVAIAAVVGMALRRQPAPAP